MASTYIQGGFSVTNNSLPVYNPNDPIINNGTLFMFDFGRTACWPSQASPADGATINNLVEGAPSATAKVTTAGITFDNGAFRFGGLANNWLDLGDNYNLSALGPAMPNVLVTFWIKRESGYSTAHYQRIIGKSTTYTGADDTTQFAAHLGAGGVYYSAAYASASGQNSGGALLQADNGPLGQFNQFGVALEAGKTTIYKNGTLLLTAATTLTGSLEVLSGIHWVIGGLGPGASGYAPLKAVIARVWCENLSATGKTALERLAADYDANHLRIIGI